ncbi:GNAT family N-acetyltransferase [Enterococcus pallens]|uniref:N-acetyltransferase domain-containing protein n=1 Tax=Enterococcus pallens ATCC BAA-351 TaxID=1158607 RepID=R2SYH2_9ENTE|nr:GNAT family N-acetyltransferase [Enterococcus pallens]EOH93039.1 hypothetical protein UAU_02681 [Enterococcus pallens ATCC BAA-351]EOU24825.1 hypothetical protein I588_00812 [Enterococcus pallens ATCC BAA-351]OJG76275.1 hypothetical protein RV10_GL003881 [Enterococcus pallens]
MIIRKATIDDTTLLIRLRLDYLLEDGAILVPEEECILRRQLKDYFSKHLSNNTFIGILAEVDTHVVAVAYLAISEKPANLSFITGKTGTLLNVLTYLEYRKQGIATKVLEKLIEEAKLISVSSIDLSATTEGKYLYKKLGFLVSNYTTMKLSLM